MENETFIAPSTSLDTRQLGRYEVLCRLSTGGMSTIYLTHQKGLGGFKKLVVLKTILPNIEGEEDFVGMFLEEARITAGFNHPHIAQVFELDVAEGQLFMAMEFVQGCTLVEMARACRQAKEPIPVGFTLAAVRDTALALHYAHNFTDARGRRRTVIHRDVAGKNIMVTNEGVTKLLDFGIAKALGRTGHTNVGMVKGTSGYMSPEQIRGEPLDPRSDIFSLGVVAHECLTGLRLFHGKTAELGMVAALRDEVQPPSKWNREVTPEMDGMVLKALRRDRDQRFPNALDFARSIERAAPGLLWHPEQSGELVSRHFASRRAETRRLLESAEFGAETTSEVKVMNVLEKVRATSLVTATSAAHQAQKESSPTAITAPDSPQLAQEVTSFARPRPRDVQTLPNPPPSIQPPSSGPRPSHITPQTAPGGVRSPPSSSPRTPFPSAPQPPPTSPRTPPAIALQPPPSGPRTPPLGMPQPPPSGPRPPSFITHPAAPPPSSPTPNVSILRAEAETSPRAPQQYSYDDFDDVADRTIPAASLPEEIANLRSQYAAQRKAVLRRVTVEAHPVDDPEPSTDGGETAPDRPQAHPFPPRSVDEMDWEDDDEAARTAIASPDDVPGLAGVRAASLQTNPAQHLAPRRSQKALNALLVLMVALAVLGLLVLLDVVPLPTFLLKAPADVGAVPR